MDAAYTRTFTVLYTCPDNGKSGLRGPIIAIREHNVILWQISRGKRNCYVIWRKIMSSHKWMIFKRSSVKVKVVEIDFHWWEKKWLTRIITSEIWGDLLEEGERVMITGSLFLRNKQGWCSGESTCLLPMWAGFRFPDQPSHVSKVYLLVLYSALRGFSHQKNNILFDLLWFQFDFS